jgi:hypothetical protein
MVSGLGVASVAAGSIGAATCCADLDERIAALEASLVGRGERRVTLSISGFVVQSLLVWDDGKVSDTYFADLGVNGSRLRFVGSARLGAAMKAGFRYEFGFAENGTGRLSQVQGSRAGGNGGSRNGDDLGAFERLRDSTIHLEHARLGRLQLGHGSTATDNLVLLDLGGIRAASTIDIGLHIGGFRLRDAAGRWSALDWQTILRGHEPWDTLRRNHVLYATPTLAGFTLQGAVAEDNYWDVALRWRGEGAGFRWAFGLGYQEDGEHNEGGFACAALCTLTTRETKGSASVLHVASGLFVTAATGERRWVGERSPGPDDDSRDARFRYLATGIARDWTGLGRTSLFLEASRHRDGGANRVALGLTAPPGGLPSFLTSHWGIGVVQHIDAAALELFASWKHYDLSVGGASLVAADGSAMGRPMPFSALLVGTRMRF